MPTITNIQHKPDKQRYWIYVDGEYCTSIRERTFPAMNLQIGMQISCEKIKEMESFHWKTQYGQAAWDKEKVRLERVKAIIQSIHPKIAVDIIGFGADTNQLIEHHPDEAGKPDLEVLLNGHPRIKLMYVEVTGTEHKRGTDYWIRPDKLQYCQNHPNEDVWIALHYANPAEHVRFVRPDPHKQYHYTEKDINGSIEHYVVFTDESSEVHQFDYFKHYVLERIQAFGA